MSNNQGLPLVNIEKVEIVTEEDTPVTYSFTTAEEATIEPFISEGEETPLRSKNSVVALLRTEDIVMGYDITLTDNVLIPEVFALVDGGTLRFDDVEVDKVVGYDAPVSGQPVNRIPFALKIYTKEVDSSGDTVKFACFTFNHCKGKPVSFNFRDNEFNIPEFNISSRPKNGESPVSFDFLDELPA